MLSPVPSKICWSQRAVNLTTGSVTLETEQIAWVKPLPCVQGSRNISGIILTHSALPERSKVHDSENLFPQLLLFGVNR